jgi:hypothetical protein
MIPAKISKRQLAGALLLMLALGGLSFGAVRFDVVGSPTEVVSTGRSEVLGSVNMVVRAAAVTGTSAGGATQIGLILSGPATQIDNTGSSGIKVITSPALAAVSIQEVRNIDLNGQCTGSITVNLPPGIAVNSGDFIRVEGIRGRIDASSGLLPGTDLFVDLQSINDPAANSFIPDRLRIAKSLRGILVESVSGTGKVQITEGFARAFIDSDAANDGVNINDRTDSDGAALGAPTNSTRVQIRLEGIPVDAISDVVWPPVSTDPVTGAALHLVDSEFSDTVSTAIYSFETPNQVSTSDIAVESFSITPNLVFSVVQCRLEALTTSVTLAPAVPAATECAEPSDTEARPRFLESYELSPLRLSPSSAIVRGPEFTLTVHGTGFVQGSTVLWNGQGRPTTFVSANTVTAAISAEDISKVGTARVSVSNPASAGGATSPSQVFTIAAPVLSLFYPRLVAADSPSAELDESEFTGIALANVSGRIASLMLTAFDREGQPIRGEGITNPAPLTLQAGEQLPRIDSEIFGAGFRSTERIGWIRLEGDVAHVVGFFLAFNGTLTRLDGADVSATTSETFVLPEIEANGFSRIHVANPADDPVTITFELLRADGTRRGTAARTINATGVLVESTAQLFPGVKAAASDYIRASATRGVVGFEYLGRASGDVQGLNGQDAGGGAATLYSPQYVTGGSQWISRISVINLSPRPGNVSFTLVGDDGVPIGTKRVLPIGPLGKIHIDDPDFFLNSGDELSQGYVTVSSDGVRLTGSVVFGNPEATFSAALPLVSRLRGDMIFGQVASNETFFTGLAIFNPEEGNTRAVLQVFDSSGEVLASKIETIPAKGRRNLLLTEFFPELAGRNISSGYIRITSIKGLAAFAIFGANNLSVLSAVPAQVFH